MITFAWLLTYNKTNKVLWLYLTLPTKFWESVWYQGGHHNGYSGYGHIDGYLNADHGYSYDKVVNIFRIALSISNFA